MIENDLSQDILSTCHVHIELDDFAHTYKNYSQARKGLKLMAESRSCIRCLSKPRLDRLSAQSSKQLK